jgi:4-diphosphocytidyl-2-C-methyl-D-erythritol kinase
MSGVAERIRVKACAKINLTLRVLGARPDGYHELRTAFQALDLHDTLTFTPAARFSIECEDASCPRDRTNLVWKAADELWRASGRKAAMPGARVTIAKRIPTQAGLGGGSSDAAAALRALSVLWNLKNAPTREVAARVGADVAFFLEGGTALGVERGDVLFPLADWPASWVVLALPDFGVSTKDAYAWFDQGQHSRPSRSSRPRRPAFPEMWNDLQGPVAAHHPEIARIVTRLERAGASYAAMSGSGSAVFGLYEARSAADRAAKGLTGPTLATLVTRTLTRKAFAAGSRPA